MTMYKHIPLCHISELEKYLFRSEIAGTKCALIYWTTEWKTMDFILADVVTFVINVIACNFGETVHYTVVMLLQFYCSSHSTTCFTRRNLEVTR